jgi:hypothetical protein
VISKGAGDAVDAQNQQAKIDTDSKANVDTTLGPLSVEANKGTDADTSKVADGLETFSASVTKLVELDKTLSEKRTQALTQMEDQQEDQRQVLQGCQGGEERHGQADRRREPPRRANSCGNHRKSKSSAVEEQFGPGEQR